MDLQDRIDKLFPKLLDNTLTKAEFEELVAIIEDSNATIMINNKLQDLWERQKNTDGLANEGRPSYNSDALYHKILDRIEPYDHSIRTKESSLRNPYKKWLGIAATLIVMMGLSLVYLQEESTPLAQPKALSVETSINRDVITLQLDNGTIQTISEDGNRTIINQEGAIVGSQQGTSINYSGNNTNNTLIYNTLSIPNGKLFDLVLSDGTKVKLNSGSSIKYPVQFLPGNHRKVFLRGEAYFEIAKDTENPFIVNANDLEVQVLGTQFNLSYYPEDPEITTVLVEGSVELYKEGADKNSNTVTRLRPGQKAEWKSAEKEMSVKQVDTELYTAWKEGYLLFKATPFSIIKTKLERHFNITIEDKDKRMENEVYTATFKEETIEEILEAFKEDISFSYTRVDNKIIITNLKTN